MIPIYKPWLTDLETEYANKAVASGWISSQGPYIQQFEEEFAKFIGVKYAVGVNNGTAACHLALLAAGIRPGDKVITTNLSFVATANAIKYCGAIPVFVDVDPSTWNMDMQQVEDAITPDVKAIFCVHLLGNPCDYEALNRIKNKYNIKIIEDACESIGASSHCRKTGSWFDVGAFSFFGNKTITTGEGGMITTNSKEIYDLARLLRGQGQTDRYFHPIVGYNYRLTNVAAAIGCAQLLRIEEIIANKRRVYNRYIDNILNTKNGWFNFSNLLNIGITQRVLPNSEHGYWMFGIKNRELYRNAKQYSNYFDTRAMFYPMTDLPPYKQYNCPGEEAKNLAETAFMLPSYPELTNDEIDMIWKAML